MSQGYWCEPENQTLAMDREMIPGPIESERMHEVLTIANRIMLNENSRTSPWLGSTIYPIGARLYYAIEDGNRYYLEFETEEHARHFFSVLSGVLMLSKTRFDMEDEREPSVLPRRSELVDYIPRPYVGRF